MLRRGAVSLCAVIRFGAIVAATAFVLVNTATSATAKLAIDQITMSGPGLDGTVEVARHQGDYLDPRVIAAHADLFKQLECRSCAERLSTPPVGMLGPQYVLTYSMPTSLGPDEEVPTSVNVVQNVYPYADPEPVIYLSPNQRIPGGTWSGGGWFFARDVLTRDLETFGVQRPIPAVVNLGTGDDGTISRFAPMGLAVMVIVGLAAVGVLMGHRLKRRRELSRAT
jgi:hypothetical protein